MYKEIKELAKKALPRQAVEMLVRGREALLASIGRMRIPFLVVSVGQACNYKCRDCGNLAPYSPEGFRRYDVNDIVQSLAIIFRHVHRLDCIQIQGGEPFLYTDLDKLLIYLGSQKFAVSGGVLAIS